MTKFKMSDFKPGQRIKLQYSEDMYLLLSNNNLANLRNGTTYKRINEVFWDVNTVKDELERLLAIRRGYELIYYDPIKHNRDIADMKLLNKLLTFDEMNYHLVRKEKIFMHWANVSYEKIQATKMRIGLVYENFVTYQAHVDLKEHNKQCVITRIEIDKERDANLYWCDLSENMYSLF